MGILNHQGFHLFSPRNLDINRIRNITIDRFKDCATVEIDDSNLQSWYIAMVRSFGTKVSIEEKNIVINNFQNHFNSDIT